MWRGESRECDPVRVSRECDEWVRVVVGGREVGLPFALDGLLSGQFI